MQAPPPVIHTPTNFAFRRKPLRARLRRWFDTTAAAIGLVLTGPVIAVAMLAIALEDGAPVTFRQRRVGQYGRTFTIHKLRTMKHAELGDRLSPRSPGDSRITRVGKFLRTTSIDELPQLLNVVRGDMALIGPRPEMPFVVHSYDRWQHLRHLMTPGLTGIWQTTARKTIALERPEATLMDLQYIATSSVSLDIALFARTVVATVLPKGAF
jgi:lipopolysaccharide/colanic/teichoic acid biosynthesis glycosyltransferase